MNRRTLLQLAGLTGLGAVAAPVLTACGGGGGSTSRIGLAASDVAFGTGDPAFAGDAVTGMSQLGGRLLGVLGTTPGNLAVSPYSIQTALSMAANGAVGPTATQMMDALGVGDLGDLNAGMAALTRHLDGLAGERKNIYGKTVTLALDTANALFGQQDTTWESAFLDALKRSYDAGMRLVDFQTDADAARVLINAWVSKQTHDRIPKLLDEGFLDSYTRLVLVNALYFKAPWLYQFEKEVTRPGPFHLADGGTIDVDVMHNLVEGVGYSDTDGRQSIRLPYVGNELAMTVVLPKPGGFDATWGQVTSGRIAELLDVEPHKNVELTLPRWTFRSHSPLKQALIGLGMEVPFDDQRADFTAMTRDEPLHISDVVHEAWIAVDEEGTEAAAATAVGMAGSAMPVSVPMQVDRPFIFVIHDVKYLAPLFVGRVMDPTAG